MTIPPEIVIGITSIGVVLLLQLLVSVKSYGEDKGRFDGLMKEFRSFKETIGESLQALARRMDEHDRVLMQQGFQIGQLDGRISQHHGDGAKSI